MSRAGLVATLAVLAAALVAPLWLDPQGYPLRVLTLVLLFAAMGQAWNVIGGLGNQVSLGHAAFFGVGAYTSTILLNTFGITPWVGMFVGGALGVLMGLVIGYPTFRLSGHYFALATLAAGEVMRIIAISWRDLTGGPRGISVPFLGESATMFQFRATTPYYYIMLAALVLVSLIFWEIQRGRTGYFLRALKEHQDAAEVIGVDTFQVKLRVMLLSAFLTALLGTLYAQFQYFFDPDSVFGVASVSVRMALIAIVGGVGALWGPVIGAAFLVPAQELANILLGNSAAGVSQLFYGVLLVAVILLNPRGLIALGQGAINRMQRR
jgi:branched-chain amino acid transport system permease protein